jgi:hypothetical protein
MCIVCIFYNEKYRKTNKKTNQEPSILTRSDPLSGLRNTITNKEIKKYWTDGSGRMAVIFTRKNQRKKGQSSKGRESR